MSFGLVDLDLLVNFVFEKLNELELKLAVMCCRFVFNDFVSFEVFFSLLIYSLKIEFNLTFVGSTTKYIKKLEDLTLIFMTVSFLNHFYFFKHPFFLFSYPYFPFLYSFHNLQFLLNSQRSWPIRFLTWRSLQLARFLVLL